MTQQDVLNLPVGTEVWWSEPNTPDHKQQGKVQAGLRGNFIRWVDGELVVIRADTVKRLAPHLRKVRGS